MATLSEFIQNSPWARSISAKHLAFVASAVVEHQLRKDEFVYRRGDPPTNWIGVIEGELRMVRFSRNGKMTALWRVPAGDWIGEASLVFLGQRRFDLIAHRASRIAYIPKDTFSWLFENSVPFNNYLVHKLAHRMGQMAAMLAVDRLQGATARTAFCLVSIAEAERKSSDEELVKISQEQLGFLAGLSRQHANRAVASLVKDGLIVLSNRRIVIHDLEGLKKLYDL